MRLENKKVIITGASRSIGAEIARQFASEGAQVLISYRSDQQGAEQVVNAITSAGGKASALFANFKSSQDVEIFYQQALDQLQGIDILVNNAGGYNTEDVLSLRIEDFTALHFASVTSPLLLSQLSAKSMVKAKTRGNIINISSISGHIPHKCRTAHGSAKAALNMLTKDLALDLADHGIRVNGIAPGAIPYEPTDYKDTNEDSIPLKRYGTPTDIAKAALYLASDDADWVTGEILLVDGGQSL